MKMVSRDPIYDSESHVVDRILGYRGPPGNRRQYLVKWKHFTGPTWEPVSNFDSMSIITKYWSNLPKVPSSGGE